MSTQDTTGVYEDHFLSARDVCTNCLRLIRVERVDPVRGGIVNKLDSHYERRRRVTQVAYGPGDEPTQSKGVFCECGVESARERIWSGDDVDPDRFEELLSAALETADRKDITLKRKEAAAYALQAHKDGKGPDEAIATGLEAGVVAAVASDD